MSVKTEYEKLLEEEKRLRRFVEKASEDFTAREQYYHQMVEKREQILKKSSGLAKRVLAKVEEYIVTAERAMKKAQKTLQGLNKKLENVLRRERECEENPIEYIEEHTPIMVQKLKEYVEEHEIDLGINIKSEMEICPKMISVTDDLGEYNKPDGNVVISMGAIIISESNEFYFKNKIVFIAKDTRSKKMIIMNTEWFEKYLQLFHKALRIKIEEAFENHPNFKVKFTDDTHFTIELR